MTDFVCSTAALASTTILKCSAPSEGLWHDVIPAIAGLAGALIGAAAAFFAQRAAARAQERLQHLEFGRRDIGIRRQVSALMKQVSRYVDTASRVGKINLVHLDVLLREVNRRIYTWDVSMALDDTQAAALYEASEAIEIARGAIKEYFYTTTPASRTKERIQLAFEPALGKLIVFWRSMRDETTALRMEGRTSIAAETD